MTVSRFMVLSSLGIALLFPSPSLNAQISSQLELQTELNGINIDLNFQEGANIIFTGTASSVAGRPAYNLNGSLQDEQPNVTLTGDGSRILTVSGGLGRIDGLCVVNSGGAAGDALATRGTIYVNGQITGGIHNSIFENNKDDATNHAVPSQNYRGVVINALGLSGGINNTIFQNNEAALGGAVYLRGGGLAGGINNSQFIDNTTLYNFDSYGAAGLTIYQGDLDGGINSSLFKNNAAAGGEGGAIRIRGNLKGGITDSEFIGNTIANGNGGALGITANYTGGAWVGGNLEGGISNSTFSANEASGMGGGISISNFDGGINGGIFSENKAGAMGGALAATGYFKGGIHNSEFIGNEATEFGGAIANNTSDLFEGGISNSTFSRNKAMNSAGGALFISNFRGDVEESTFQGNSVEKGSASTDFSYGGAMAVWTTFEGDIRNTDFIDNTAVDGGGALYTPSFTGNIEDSVFSGNSGGRGGALYIGSFDGMLQNSNFTGNRAEGLDGVYATGLGGAIYATNDWSITGSSFLNNTAETSHSGDLTSGRGGAIFHNNNSGGGSSTFTIAAVDADNPVVFSGNNHNPGAAGLESNGIYFGTTLTDGGVQTTNFEVSAGAEAFVNMYDPMASQGDNLTNSNGDIYNRLVVNVDKTGAGTWLLGGHNKMQSESHWNIREGELHLVGGVSLLSRSADNPAVTIELSHPDSSFTLHPGARLMAAIGGESHLISANEIHLLAGSTAGVIGLYNQPFVVPNALPDAPLEVLTLSHGSLLRHEQEIEQQSGVMEVGLSNYNYRLYWGGPDNTILYLDYISLAGPDDGQTSLRSRAAIEALSAPGAMALASMTGDRLTDRTRGLFWTENFRPEKNGFWVAPYLGRRNKSGQPGAYDIDTYGGMIGYDYQLGGYSASPAFLGLAFDWTRSDYDSRDADLKGKKYEGLVYGGLTLPGEVELTGYAGVGRTNYDQQRKVGDFNYSSDYDSSHYRLGLELGRRWAINDCFSIRPFASYEYLRLKVDGYNEGLGAYAAKLDGFTQSPQKLKTGVGLNWTDSERFFLEGRVYYAGLLSGREAETDLSFTQNDQVVYKIKGDELGRDALGLNLAATFNINNTASLKLDGVMERGDNTTDRQGRLTLNIVW